MRTPALYRDYREHFKTDGGYRPRMRRVWPNCLREEDGDHVHAGAAYATGSNERGSRRATV